LVVEVAEKSVVNVQGWVEVIVRDKHGRIKYRSPPIPVEGSAEEKGGNPHTLPVHATFPSGMPMYYWRKNIITDAGIAEMIRLVFAGLTGTKFGYIAIGTGTTAESPTDTALGNEIKRKAADVTQTTTTITGDTARLTATFSSADGLKGTSAVSEAGVFNAATGGVLLARKTFPPVNVNWDAGDTLTINYYIQITR
jgi:hypothetical protein